MDDGTSTPRPRRDDRRRRQAARRRLSLLFVLLIVAAAVVVAIAIGRGEADEKATATQGAPSHSARPAATPPKVWAASASAPVRIWVGGDSMGGELGWSLAPLIEATHVLWPTLFYKESSGICRWDFFDWGEQMRAVMRTARPHAVVVMIGTNDTQSVWRDGKWISYGTAAWKSAYEQRVSDMMETMFTGGARRVYWVGMPIMKQAWRNSRMKLINRIVRGAVAEHTGAAYVDAWSLFVDADGDYDGAWRLGDGVHFTVEGQRRLAEAVFAGIERDWLPDGLPAPGSSPSAGPSASAGPAD